jgi:hypothetical protein
MNLIEMQRLAQSLNRPGQVIINEEFQVYSTGRPTAGIAAVSGTQTPNIQIRADSDFVIEKTTFSADIAAAAQTASTRVLPNVNVQIVITSSGRQLFNVQAPLTGLFGDGQLPFIWPKPYIVPASSTLQIQLVSFEAAIVPFITLNFIGRVLFWGMPLPQPMPVQNRR